jgi:hypothetical protein
LYAPEHLGSHLQPLSDIELIRLWVERKSPRSKRFSWQAAHRFRLFVEKPLAEVTLTDVETFAAAMRMSKLAPGFYKQTLLALKSLFAFGQQTGILPATIPLHGWPIGSAGNCPNASVLDSLGLCASVCAFFWVE